MKKPLSPLILLRPLIMVALLLSAAIFVVMRADPNQHVALGQQSGTATPAEEPVATTTPAEEPANTTTPAEEPAATTTPAEESMATTTPAEEPATTTTPLAETPVADATAEATTADKNEASDTVREATPTPTPAPLTDEELISMGEEEFSKYCAACHQADGQGIPNAYPALARNGFVLAEDPSGVLRVIFTGRAGMPHFREALSTQQIAAIVSYIRNSWENEASTVSAEQVRTVEEEIYSPAEPMEHDGSSE